MAWRGCLFSDKTTKPAGFSGAHMYDSVVVKDLTEELEGKQHVHSGSVFLSTSLLLKDVPQQQQQQQCVCVSFSSEACFTSLPD